MVDLVLISIATFMLLLDITIVNVALPDIPVGGGTPALIAREFHGRERATAFGVWGATIGGAVAIGPLVGGVLTEHLGWEWVFFVNVPIGLVAQDAAPVDVPGVITFASGLLLLIFGLIRGNAEGWGSPVTLGAFAGAALGFALVRGRDFVAAGPPAVAEAAPAG